MSSINKPLSLSHNLRKFAGHWKLPISLGLLTIGVYGVASYGFGLLLYDITNTTGWSVSSMSLANTLGSIGGAGFGVLAGISLRWISAKKMMSAGLLIGLSAIWGASLSSTQSSFIICWTVGASTLQATLYYHISMALVARKHKNDRAKAFMILTLVGGFSSPIFIPLGGLIASLNDWRFTMQIMTLAAVLFAIPGLLAAPSRPPVIENIRPDAINNSKESNGRKRGIELLLRNRQLIFITFVFSLSSLVINGIQFHHVAAIQTFGFSLATAVSISSARGFLSLPGRAALAYMENQLGTKRALSCVYTMTLISILPFLLEPTLPTMWAFGIIGGLGFGTILPLQGLLASESISDSNFEASLAAQQGAALFIGSFGALTFGALYDLTSNYQTVFLTAAAIQLFAIVLLQFHSRPEK